MSPGLGRLLSTALLGAIALPSLPASDPVSDLEGLIAAGDRAFERRAQGARDSEADPAEIASSVSAYRSALELRPDDVGLRSKLLRSLLFQAEYATRDEEAKKRLFEQGRDLFEAGLSRLEQRHGENIDELGADALRQRLREVPEAGALFFWGSVHWGLWGQYFGKVASVRKGVASRIRRYGEAALALAPEISDAGPYRLLGRLHALSPRVPMFTGWIDRDQALVLLEQAVARAPENPLNRFFLGEALLEYRPRERERALELIRGAAQATPRAGQELEDAKAIRDAQHRLAEPNGS